MSLFSKKRVEKVQHKIMQDQGIVFQRVVGNVSASDIVKGFKKVFDDEQFQVGLHWIIDVRKSKTTFRPDHMEPIIENMQENKYNFNHAKLALIIGNNHHAASGGKMKDYFKQAYNDVKLRMFVNSEMAYKWLIAS